MEANSENEQLVDLVPQMPVRDGAAFGIPPTQTRPDVGHLGLLYKPPFAWQRRGSGRRSTQFYTAACHHEDPMPSGLKVRSRGKCSPWTFSTIKNLRTCHDGIPPIDLPGCRNGEGVFNLSIQGRRILNPEGV